MYTITEALAEFKTNVKKIEKKRETIRLYLTRSANMTDPIKDEGGSLAFIGKELQAINDLEDRNIAIRRAIAEANATVQVKIKDETRTIAGWLTWKKEILPRKEQFLTMVRSSIESARMNAQKQGVAAVFAGQQQTVNIGNNTPTQLLVNYDEKILAKEIEDLTQICGELDGALSLKNATVQITI